MRNVWSDITPNSCHFDQAFSDDGGKTWEENWVAKATRVTDESAAAETSLSCASTIALMSLIVSSSDLIHPILSGSRREGLAKLQALSAIAFEGRIGKNSNVTAIVADVLPIRTYTHRAELTFVDTVRASLPRSATYFAGL